MATTAGKLNNVAKQKNKGSLEKSKGKFFRGFKKGKKIQEKFDQVKKGNTGSITDNSLQILVAAKKEKIRKPIFGITQSSRIEAFNKLNSIHKDFSNIVTDTPETARNKHTHEFIEIAVLKDLINNYGQIPESIKDNSLTQKDLKKIASNKGLEFSDQVMQSITEPTADTADTTDNSSYKLPTNITVKPLTEQIQDSVNNLNNALGISDDVYDGYYGGSGISDVQEARREFRTLLELNSSLSTENKEVLTQNEDFKKLITLFIEQPSTGTDSKELTLKVLEKSGLVTKDTSGNYHIYQNKKDILTGLSSEDYKNTDFDFEAKEKAATNIQSIAGSCSASEKKEFEQVKEASKNSFRPVFKKANTFWHKVQGFIKLKHLEAIKSSLINDRDLDGLKEKSGYSDDQKFKTAIERSLQREIATSQGTISSDNIKALQKLNPESYSSKENFIKALVDGLNNVYASVTDKNKTSYETKLNQALQTHGNLFSQTQNNEDEIDLGSVEPLSTSDSLRIARKKEAIGSRQFYTQQKVKLKNINEALDLLEAFKNAQQEFKQISFFNVNGYKEGLIKAGNDSKANVLEKDSLAEQFSKKKTEIETTKKGFDDITGKLNSNMKVLFDDFQNIDEKTDVDILKELLNDIKNNIETEIKVSNKDLLDELKSSALPKKDQTSQGTFDSTLGSEDSKLEKAKNFEDEINKLLGDSSSIKIIGGQTPSRKEIQKQIENLDDKKKGELIEQFKLFNEFIEEDEIQNKKLKEPSGDKVGVSKRLHSNFGHEKQIVESYLKLLGSTPSSLEQSKNGEGTGGGNNWGEMSWKRVAPAQSKLKGLSEPSTIEAFKVISQHYISVDNDVFFDTKQEESVEDEFFDAPESPEEDKNN